MYQCTLLTKQTSEWHYTNEHNRILMILSKFLLCCGCLSTVLPIKEPEKNTKPFIFQDMKGWLMYLADQNHCSAQLSKIPPFCMSYHKGGRYEGLNSKQFLITTIAWSILMEWNCGMQVTGFIIIHNNNIGCISVNVSA